MFAGVGASGCQSLQQRAAHRLSTAHQPRQPDRTDVGRTVHQRGHQTGHRGDLGDGLAFHQRAKRFGVAVLGIVGQNHGGPRRQTGQQFHAAFEERHRGLGQPDVVGSRRIVPELPIQPGRHRALSTDRALRLVLSIRR